MIKNPKKTNITIAVSAVDGLVHKIKSGFKVPAQNGKQSYPKSADHFVIKEHFPELIPSYGEEPKNLIVFLPSNNVAECFEDSFALYSAKNKLRSCDGETCLFRMSMTVAGKQYGAGEEAPCVCPNLPEKGPDGKKNKERCKYVAYLKAWVCVQLNGQWRIDNTACYLFETGSENSGSAIKSELFKIWELTGGRLMGIPFEISVKMVPGKENIQVKFPIWSFRMVGLLSDNQQPELRGGIAVGNVPLLTDGAPVGDEEEGEFAEVEVVGETPKVSIAERIELIEEEFTKAEQFFTMVNLQMWREKHIKEIGTFDKATQEAFKAKYVALKARIESEEPKPPEQAGPEEAKQSKKRSSSAPVDKNNPLGI